MSSDEAHFKNRRNLRLEGVKVKSELDNLQETMKLYQAQASQKLEYVSTASNTKGRQQELDAFMANDAKWKGYRARELSLSARLKEIEAEVSNADYTQRNRLASAMERLGDGVFALVAVLTVKKEG